MDEAQKQHRDAGSLALLDQEKAQRALRSSGMRNKSSMGSRAVWHYWPMKKLSAREVQDVWGGEGGASDRGRCTSGTMAP